MRKTLIILLILGIAVFVVGMIFVSLNRGEYIIYLSDIKSDGNITVVNVSVTCTPEDLVEIKEVREEDGIYHAAVKALKPGNGVMNVDAVTINRKGETGGTGSSFAISVDPFLGISCTEATGSYYGSHIIILLFAGFIVTAFILFTLGWIKCLRKNEFSYDSPGFITFGCFTLILLVMVLSVLIPSLADPKSYDLDMMFLRLSFGSLIFVNISMPVLAAFAVFMGVSNGVLVKKEGKRLANIAGFAIAAVLLVAAILCGIMAEVNIPLPAEVQFVLTGIFAGVICYAECMLLGIIICALRAAAHEPLPDKDYIIILGCGIAKDGTLLPLLRGRVDRALAFAGKQENAGKKQAVFVPSGGQGPDEVIAEGEAMRRYLLAQGIPEERILSETASATTFQNMKFSKEIIGENKGDASANIAFSTTNYHVFRSGILAGKAGMEADGMGSRTRWYFWPNAFMREVVSMFVSDWKKHVPALAVFVLFQIMITMMIL